MLRNSIFLFALVVLSQPGSAFADGTTVMFTGGQQVFFKEDKKIYDRIVTAAEDYNKASKSDKLTQKEMFYIGISSRGKYLFNIEHVVFACRGDCREKQPKQIQTTTQKIETLQVETGTSVGKATEAAVGKNGVNRVLKEW